MATSKDELLARIAEEEGRLDRLVAAQEEIRRRLETLREELATSAAVPPAPARPLTVASAAVPLTPGRRSGFSDPCSTDEKRSSPSGGPRHGRPTARTVRVGSHLIGDGKGFAILHEILRFN